MAYVTEQTWLLLPAPVVISSCRSLGRVPADSYLTQSCHRLSHRRRTPFSSFAPPDVKIRRHAAAAVLVAAPGARETRTRTRTPGTPRSAAVRCSPKRVVAGSRPAQAARPVHRLGAKASGASDGARCVQPGRAARTPVCRAVLQPQTEPQIPSPGPSPVSSRPCPGTTHTTQPLGHSAQGGPQYLRICVPRGAGRTIVLIGPCSRLVREGENRSQRRAACPGQPGLEFGALADCDRRAGRGT